MTKNNTNFNLEKCQHFKIFHHENVFRNICFHIGAMFPRFHLSKLKNWLRMYGNDTRKYYSHNKSISWAVFWIPLIIKQKNMRPLKSAITNNHYWNLTISFSSNNAYFYLQQNICAWVISEIYFSAAARCTQINWDRIFG